MTEDPITLRDSPPSVRDRAALTVFTDVGGTKKKNAPMVALTYAHQQMFVSIRCGAGMPTNVILWFNS